MGKAVNLMLNGGRAKGVAVPENSKATITTGKGGIPASLKVKAAGTSPAPTPASPDANRVKVEKINNLF